MLYSIVEKQVKAWPGMVKTSLGATSADNDSQSAHFRSGTMVIHT